MPVHFGRQATALTLALSFLVPTLSGCGSKGNDTTAQGGGSYSAPAPNTMNQPATNPNPGLSGKQKLVLLGGAALLYYIYKKDKANNAAAAQAGPNGKPQLYREEKGPNTGAIYYRKNDPQHTVVWVTAPSQGVQVPADQVQRYAPDYQQYGNNAPQIPAGAQTVPASQYDPSLAGSPGGPPGPHM